MDADGWTERTFLFTDIEGSTRLWQSDPEGMRAALARHDALIRGVVEEAGGEVFKTIGDAFCVAFSNTLRAIEAAVAIQAKLESMFADSPVRLRVRMALHCGLADARDGDYFGPALNLVARVLAAGHGGQILTTAAVQERVGGAGCLTLGEHHLKDIAGPCALFQWKVPGGQDHFPPLRSLGNVRLPGNVPELRGPTIGRESLRNRLAQTTVPGSCTTLTGPGGTGKTRVALDTAHRVRERFSDGVWWVALESIQYSSAVVGAVAAAVGLREEPGVPLIETVVQWFSERNSLIIVDNCEHLLDSVGQVIARLMDRSPGLAVLATSREALGLPGEHRLPIPPLDMPSARVPADPTEVAASEAGRWFVERARLYVPDFAVDASNADAVSSLCRRVDGIPLAIELAAARMRALSVQEIDRRLDQRLRLLTGGARTGAARQQTLRSAIDWSHDLLGEDERRVFRRLSVFHGGWTLAAAEAVCSDPSMDAWDVLERLTQLVDKSLVVADSGGGTTRYRMLETLRVYAAERLDAADEAEVVRLLHAEHYAVSLAGGAQLPDEVWLATVDTEYGNVLAALSHAPVNTAARVALALEDYWHRRGLWGQACYHLRAVSERGPDPALDARLNGIEGWFHNLRGESGQARSRSEAALGEALRADDPESEAIACNTIAFLDWREGNTDSARSGFERSLALLRRSGDRRRQAGRLSNLGLLATVAGDWRQARDFLEEALSIYADFDDRQGIGTCHCNLADLHLASGCPVEGLDQARLGLDCFHACQDVPGQVYCLANIAEAHAQLGNGPEAVATAEEALQRCASAELEALRPLLAEIRDRAQQLPDVSPPV